MTQSEDERNKTSAVRHEVPETSRAELDHQSLDAQVADRTLSCGKNMTLSSRIPRWKAQSHSTSKGVSAERNSKEEDSMDQTIENIESGVDRARHGTNEKGTR